MNRKYAYKLLLVVYCIIYGITLSAQQVYQVRLSKPGSAGRLVAKLDDISIRVSGYDEETVKITVTKNGKQVDETALLFDFLENNNTVTIIRRPGERVTNILVSVKVPRNFSADLKTYWKESIEISGISGKIKSNTYNGSLSVENSGSDLDLSSYYGDVRASGISGAVVAYNYYGLIALSFAKLEQYAPMSIVNSYGNLDLSFPAGSSASLAIGTYKGKIHSDFALQPSVNVLSPGNTKAGTTGVHRKINGGGVAIRVQNYNGNITIKKL